MSAFCFGSGKDILNCIEIKIHTVHRVPTQFNLENNLGVSHLSGMSVSIRIMLWSETDEPNYLQVNRCHDVQIRVMMFKIQGISHSGCWR